GPGHRRDSGGVPVGAEAEAVEPRLTRSGPRRGGDERSIRPGDDLPDFTGRRRWRPNRVDQPLPPVRVQLVHLEPRRPPVPPGTVPPPEASGATHREQEPWPRRRPAPSRTVRPGRARLRRVRPHPHHDGHHHHRHPDARQRPPRVPRNPALLRHATIIPFRPPEHLPTRAVPTDIAGLLGGYGDGG